MDNERHTKQLPDYRIPAEVQVDITVHYARQTINEIAHYDALMAKERLGTAKSRNTIEQVMIAVCLLTTVFQYFCAYIAERLGIVQCQLSLHSIATCRSLPSTSNQ